MDPQPFLNFFAPFAARLATPQNPPQHVLDALDDVKQATKDNSYWTLLWEVLKMFAKIFTDDRDAEWEMVESLQTCANVAEDYAKDPTGLTALSTLGKCYEAEMDMIDLKYDGTYKPSLPEYNEFWRLIDPRESIMFAMVSDKTDTEPVNWIKVRMGENGRESRHLVGKVKTGAHDSS